MSRVNLENVASATDMFPMVTHEIGLSSMFAVIKCVHNTLLIDFLQYKLKANSQLLDPKHERHKK